MKCSKCLVDKPYQDFSPSELKRNSTRCKLCRNNMVRQYHYIKSNGILRPQKGETHWKWIGGRITCLTGYILVLKPMHPKANLNGYVYEHRWVTENVLGEPLPPNAVVHHVDGNRANNSPDNLVVCQDENYHRLLHQRQRAYDACGHANWRKCAYCGEYDNPNNMYRHNTLIKYWHRSCKYKYAKERLSRLP